MTADHRSFPDAADGRPLPPMAAGQDCREDGGGFFARAIMALFGRKPDPIVTYRQAAQALLSGVSHDR